MTDTSFQQDDPVILVNQVRNKVVKKYAKKYGLKPSAIIDSMFEGIVRDVGVGFHINRVISKEFARKILLECVQDFVTEINADLKLRPFLGEFPFSDKNVEVYLIIFESDGSNTHFPDLYIAEARRGYVSFKTKDKDQEIGYKTEEEETFEEALERLKETTAPEESF